MPTINKKAKKRPREPLHSNTKEVYDTVYNTTRWRKLRLQKLQDNPLCECCLQDNKITPAEEVHHITEILRNPDLAFDYKNLMSLCRKCHKEIHKKK